MKVMVTYIFVEKEQVKNRFGVCEGCCFDQQDGCHCPNEINIIRDCEDSPTGYWEIRNIELKEAGK